MAQLFPSPRTNLSRILLILCQCAILIFAVLASAISAQRVVSAALSTSTPAGPSNVATRHDASRPDVTRFRTRVDAALAEAHAAKAFWAFWSPMRDAGKLIRTERRSFLHSCIQRQNFHLVSRLRHPRASVQFRTTLESKAQLSADGHLNGDLVFVGRGDPDISDRKFPYAGKVEHDGPTEKVLAQMVDEAIAEAEQIDGDLLADDS